MCVKTDNTGEEQEPNPAATLQSCLEADKGSSETRDPQMRRLILGRGSIRGLASAVMNYSTSTLPSVPVVGTVKTESRGFD